MLAMSLVWLSAALPAKADDDACAHTGAQNCLVLLPHSAVATNGASSVPEPASLAVFAAGAAGLAFVRRRRYAAAERAKPSGTAK